MLCEKLQSWVVQHGDSNIERKCTNLQYKCNYHHFGGSWSLIKFWRSTTNTYRRHWIFPNWKGVTSMHQNRQTNRGCRVKRSRTSALNQCRLVCLECIQHAKHWSQLHFPYACNFLWGETYSLEKIQTWRREEKSDRGGNWQVIESQLHSWIRLHYLVSQYGHGEEINQKMENVCGLHQPP